MKKNIIFLVITLTTIINIHAQNSFEKKLTAARNGDVNAQYELGCCYYDGIGVLKDYQLAVYWFHRAAKKKNVDAQLALGKCCFYGYGVDKQDYKLAVSWFQKAAKKENSEAQLLLGDCFYNGLGVKKDSIQSVYWYRKSANLGNAQAQYMMGTLYSSGSGVEKNDSLAVEWYKKAAEQKNTRAMYVLGNCYYSGYGVKKDSYLAFKWYREAAELKYPVAQRCVGMLYDKGEGTRRDLDKAIEWYRKASQNGDDRAKEYLARAVSERQKQQEEEKKLLVRTVPQILPENTYVVVIGNEKYKHVDNVLYAENDAKEFKEYVKKEFDLPDSHIKLFVNATLNDMNRAVGWLQIAMNFNQEKGTAIWYYAGHGIPSEDDREAYLLPSNGDVKDKNTGFPLKELYKELGGLNSQCTLVFFDACFSGEKRGGGMLIPAQSMAREIKLSVPQGNMIVFSASTGSEAAFPFEQRKHGLFTYNLLEKLQSVGEFENITLGNLSDYLNEKVKQMAFENGMSQSPTIRVSSPLHSVWRDIKLPHKLEAKVSKNNQRKKTGKTASKKLKNGNNSKEMPEIEKLAKMLQSQDDELNTAYYMIATKSALKKINMYKNRKVDFTNLDKSYFKDIDIRVVTEIPINSKDVTLLTQMPGDSYTIEKNPRTKTCTLRIIDPSRFWMISKFLIIRTD